MRSIRGFVTKSASIKNQPGIVSEHFELSPLALTYTRERGEYQDSDFVGDVLHTFKARNLDTGETYELPQTQVQEILAVVSEVLTYMQQNTYPYDTVDLQNTILTFFNGKIQNFVLGALHVGSERTVPEWMSWDSLTHPETDIRIWTRNEAFENQYTDYEIVTVPPVDLLDRFFGNYGDLATQLNTMTVGEMVERIQTYKGIYPDTYTRVYSFDYINPNNQAQKTSVMWGVLVYGKNGDNIDAIKDAIAQYVLENSTHSEAEWKVTFPDIFKRTEFLFYPRWDKIAIPNLTELSAIYSSASDPIETLQFARAKWNSISPAFVESNLTILPFDYKAITVLALNGISNIEGRRKLMELFKDYIPVSTSSLDFNRMSIYTRDWILMMVELIKIAETATEFTSIANPMRRVYRDGILYITRMYDSVNYMVAARSNGA